LKFSQEFDVPRSVGEVWEFFEEAARVAKCIPGLERVEVLDSDHLVVRMTQKLGPFGATFESKVHITERVREEKIQFTATGKAVRGAIGNFHSTNTVNLHSAENQTHVVVQGELALAGVLGSVGQKVIMGQAEKVTAAFAQNLSQALSAANSVPASKNSP
jgi:carbon monoxide dehydrogenase subunit G